MNVLAVDDERLILEDMKAELRKIFKNDDITGFEDGNCAIDYANDLAAHDETLDFAFLDINLRGMTGIELAKKIKEIHHETKIIFCTAYSEYAYDAFRMHAVGYLLKPVEARHITETLNALNIDWKNTENTLSKDIRAQTFGNFELFVDNHIVSFQREKAKELFAYLIDRNGAAVTTGEIVSVLWEDRPIDKTTLNQAHTIISSLKKTLKENGVGSIIIKTWNHIAVDTTRIKCDVYDFYKGDAIAINSYRGEYMAQYSWAEMTNADLMNKAHK